MQILGTKHIFPTSINNPADNLIKGVNSMRLGAKMTMMIMKKVAIWWEPDHKTGKRGLGMWRIGSTMVLGVLLNVVGGGEADPPLHVFHRVAILHIL